LNRPGHEIVGKVHVKQIYEIALIKQKDEHLKDIGLEQLCRCIIGSTLSMGLEVVDTPTVAAAPGKK
jgi:large subunit ribosomal protein L11